VEVKKPGRYRIVAMYSNLALTISFSLNQKPAADCKLPLDTAKQFPPQNYPDWMHGTSGTKRIAGKSVFPKQAANS
jgi:hypothetical protein